ncbi:MAG: YfhO family protein [Thermomicrobiales bacterium]
MMTSTHPRAQTALREEDVSGAARRAWWRPEWPLAVLLLIVLIVSLATFGNVASYIRGDWPTMFVPPYAFLGERLRALAVPGWNPYQFSGVPFAADPSSGWMYLPAMVIYAALAPFPATTVFIAFHLLLSAVAAYALARLTGLIPLAAFITGLSFVLPWAVPAAASAVLMLQVTTWLPIALIGVEITRRAVRHWQRLAGIALSGAAISQILAAWLGQAAYYSLLVIGGWVAWRTLVTPPPGWTWRTRLTLCLVTGIGVLVTGTVLNAAALLIRLDANARSNSPGGEYTGISGWTNTTLGMEPAEVVRSLAGAFSSGAWLYAGAAVIALAILAPVLATRWPPLLFWLFVPAFAIALVFPEPTVIAKVAYALLPRFEAIHTHLHSRILMVVPLSVAMLAGASVNALLKQSVARRMPLQRMLALAAPVIVAVIAVVSWRAELISRGALTAALAVLAIALVAMLAPRQTHPYLLAAAVAAIIVWDPVGRGIVAGWGANAGPDRSLNAALGGELDAFLHDNGAATFIKQATAEEPGRYAGFDPSLLPRPSRHGELPPQAYRNAWLGPANWLLVHNWGTWFGIEDIQGYNPIHIRRYGEYIDAMNGHRQEYHETNVFTPGISSPLLDLLNLRYFVVPANAADRRDLAAMATKLPVPYQDEHVLVIENPEALPRAWIVHEARTLPEEDILPSLADGSVNPREVALLEDPPPALSNSEQQGSDSAHYTRLSPESFSVAASTATPGLLVLSEIWDPGWQVTVDGEPARVLRANDIFMAVPLEPGEHVVAFHYLPPHFWLGVAVTLSGAFGLLGGAVWLYRQERKPNHASGAAVS